MRCPWPACDTLIVDIIATRKPDHVSPRGVRQDQRSHNLTRRQYRCRQGHKFWTIELPESVYEQLVTNNTKGPVQ